MTPSGCARPSPLALLALACLSGQALAGDAGLEAVLVKGQALSESANQPYSVRQFAQDDIRERQISQPEQLFREVAGMEVRGLGYGGVANAMTLRGFAGGGHGGDIGFVVDGVPLNEASSHADGYADLNVIVPLELKGMTVFKGPVSALYGNFNRAGVVALESRKGGDYLEADLRYGSFDSVDLQIARGGKSGGATLNAAIQFYSSDGFRDQSGHHRATVTGRAAFALSGATRLALSARLHSARADTASVISQVQYNDRDRFFTKNPNVQNDGSDKGYFTLRTDLAHALAPNLKALFFAYGTRQAFTRYFTRMTNATTWQQRAEDYVRQVAGYGANLNGTHFLAGAPLTWVAGLEHYREDTLFRYADALNQRNIGANTLTAGVNGGAGTLDRNLALRSTSLLAQAEWEIDPRFRPSIGLRRDVLGGGCARRGVETRTGASAQCGDMPGFAITTPKLGLRTSLAPGLAEGRASIAEGYALPGDAAKFTPGLGVAATRFRQTEIGLVLTPGAAWFIDLGAYRIDSRDEVALTNPATLTYSNVGKTRRQGLEAEIRVAPADWFEASAALAHVRTEIRAAAPASPFLPGAEVTGVPRHMATLTATLRPAAHYTLGASLRQVGRYAISLPTATAAAVFYPGYSSLDLVAGHERTANGKRQRYHLRIANLGDRRYATSASVTDGVVTYNPAPPRTLELGAALDF